MKYIFFYEKTYLPLKISGYGAPLSCSSEAFFELFSTFHFLCLPSLLWPSFVSDTISKLCLIVHIFHIFIFTMSKNDQLANLESCFVDGGLSSSMGVEISNDSINTIEGYSPCFKSNGYL